jgi:hypothetical protein
VTSIAFALVRLPDKFPGSNILLYDAASCGRVTLQVLGAADDLLPLGSNVVDLGL